MYEAIAIINEANLPSQYFVFPDSLYNSSPNLNYLTLAIMPVSLTL